MFPFIQKSLILYSWCGYLYYWHLEVI